MELSDPGHAALHPLQPLLGAGPRHPGGATQHLIHHVSPGNSDADIMTRVPCVQVPLPRALHRSGPRGVLQHQVQTGLQGLPGQGQHVHTRAQEGELNILLCLLL